MPMKLIWDGSGGPTESRKNVVSVASLTSSSRLSEMTSATMIPGNGIYRTTGSRRDPWQFQMSVPITRLDTQETYRFTTGSKGGLACLGKLTRAFGRRVQDEKVPGLPVVELKADHYKHRTYGKMFTPSMTVVGWTGSDGKPLSLAEDMDDEVGF